MKMTDKRLIKRVTVEYYEVEDQELVRMIEVTTKKETWCDSSRGDPIVSYTSEVY